MKVNAKLLKEMVSKAEKASSNNKLIPITQLMCIKVSDNQLTLITTDATNYFYVSKELESDDFYAVIPVEQFSKLVSKITSDEVELILEERALVVKANGSYSIELPLDENGDTVVYTDPISEYDEIEYSESISCKDISTVLEYVQPSIATTDSQPVLTNYFAGESIIATNQYEVAQFNSEIIGGEHLISADLMMLLGELDGESFTYALDDNVIIAHSNDCTIYGILDSIEDYPIDTLETLLNEKFQSSCKVPRQDVVNMLERIALFINKYDNKTIRLTFSKESLSASNKSNKSVESVDYSSCKKHKDFTCLIDVEMLLSQLKAYSNDVVEIHYGRENSIKLIADDNVRQIIALNE